MSSSDEPVAVPVPFDVTGGRPFIYRVTLPAGQQFDLIVTPNITEVFFMEGVPNPSNPALPLFRMNIQLNAVTKAVVVRALRTLQMFRSWGKMDEFALSTDDRGITLEFSRPESSRQLLVVIPVDGSTQYFTARDDNFRKAGVILDDFGVQSLGNWVSAKATELSPRGLQIASGADRQRAQAHIR